MVTGVRSTSGHAPTRYGLHHDIRRTGKYCARCHLSEYSCVPMITWLGLLGHDIVPRGTITTTRPRVLLCNYDHNYDHKDNDMTIRPHDHTLLTTTQYEHAYWLGMRHGIMRASLDMQQGTERKPIWTYNGLVHMDHHFYLSEWLPFYRRAGWISEPTYTDYEQVCELQQVYAYAYVHGYAHSVAYTWGYDGMLVSNDQVTSDRG